MPDPAWSAAIAEALASAPAGEVVLVTLELYHPAFTAPIRVVADRVPLDARLEASAPRDAGAVVTFAAYAFDLGMPEVSPTGVPEVTIEIDNVSREITAALQAAVTSGQKVEVILRHYLASTALDGPEADPPFRMTLLSASADAFRVRARAGWPSLLDRRFPAEAFDTERFPGLAP